MMQGARILVVDDDRGAADALKAVKEKNARVCPAAAPAKAAEVPQKRGLFFWE